MLYNLYHSVGYEQLADYLKKQVRPHLLGYLQMLRGKTDEREEKLLCVLCEETLVGTLMRWICDTRRTTNPLDIDHATKHIITYFVRAIRKTAMNGQQGGEEV